MKIEGLIADITSVWSPASAESGLFKVILDICWPIRTTFLVGETLRDLGIPSL